MTGNPDSIRKNSAENCKKMMEVRHEIDRIDKLLVNMLAERQTYIDAAARIKTKRDQIRDHKRIDDVLNHISKQADQSGLSKEIAQPLWKVLIEKSIAHELAIWERSQTDDKA